MPNTSQNLCIPLVQTPSAYPPVYQLEKYGKQVYNNNSTMKDIANLMEHPMFADFFDKYFNDKYDAESIIKMMLTYHKLSQTKYKGSAFNPYQKIAVLYELMSNAETRRAVLFGISDDSLLQILDIAKTLT